MKIANKLIDNNNPCFIIAEVGVNHNGDMALAKELIKLASILKADAVKFQTFIPEDLYSKVVSPQGIDFLKPYQLSKEQHIELMKYAEENKIIFISTPFDFKSAEMLYELNVPAFKIASGELNYLEYLEFIARFNKPMIISSGKGSLGNIEKAKNAIFNTGNKELAILHCVSAYPAEDSSLNLNVLTTLKQAFPDCVIGYSDHSLGIEASIVATVLGAKIIEKHFTLDKSLHGPDHKASADPAEFEKLVEAIRRAEKMLGKTKKEAQPCELEINRSLVFTRNMKQGELIKSDDIIAKRPAGGLSPEIKHFFVGKSIIKDVQEDQFVSFDLI